MKENVALLYRAMSMTLAGFFVGLLCAGCSDSDYEIQALRKEVNQLKADVRDLKRRSERRFTTERPARSIPAEAGQGDSSSDLQQSGKAGGERNVRRGRSARPSREEMEARRQAMRNPETRRKIMEERRRRHEERRREIENSIKSNVNTTSKED